MSKKETASVCIDMKESGGMREFPEVNHDVSVPWDLAHLLTLAIPSLHTAHNHEVNIYIGT